MASELQRLELRTLAGVLSQHFAEQAKVVERMQRRQDALLSRVLAGGGVEAAPVATPDGDRAEPESAGASDCGADLVAGGVRGFRDAAPDVEWPVADGGGEEAAEFAECDEKQARADMQVGETLGLEKAGTPCQGVQVCGGGSDDADGGSAAAGPLRAGRAPSPGQAAFRSLADPSSEGEVTPPECARGDELPALGGGAAADGSLARGAVPAQRDVEDDKVEQTQTLAATGVSGSGGSWAASRSGAPALGRVSARGSVGRDPPDDECGGQDEQRSGVTLIVVEGEALHQPTGSVGGSQAFAEQPSTSRSRPASSGDVSALRAADDVQIDGQEPRAAEAPVDQSRISLAWTDAMSSIDLAIGASGAAEGARLAAQHLGLVYPTRLAARVVPKRGGGQQCKAKLLHQDGEVFAEVVGDGLSKREAVEDVHAKLLAVQYRQIGLNLDGLRGVGEQQQADDASLRNFVEEHLEVVLRAARMSTEAERQQYLRDELYSQLERQRGRTGPL